MEQSICTEVKEMGNLFLFDLYTKGDDIQKLSVIQSLPQLLTTDNQATITRILPKIQQELPNASSEFHIVTSKVFKTLIEMDLSINLLVSVMQGIENRDPVVSNAWIETLILVIPSLPEVAIKSDIMNCATKMSQLNRPIYHRESSCKMLGAICLRPNMTAHEVKRDILPLAQSLCQDCFAEVRAAMCLELPNIAKGLGNDSSVKSSLLPCLVELSSDDKVSVRTSAIYAIVSITQFLQADSIKQTILPLVKNFCNNSSKEGDTTFPVIAKVFGQLLINIQPFLTHSEGLWLLTFYKQLSKRGLTMITDDLELDPQLSVSCRESCAYNMPAVTYFISTHCPSEINNWYPTFRDLAGDPYYLVRKTMAGCLHEVARILEKENKLLVTELVKLLKDNAEEVLDSLVPNIACIFELLSGSNVLSRENVNQTTLEIGRALLKCQTELFKCYSWRRKMTFLVQLEFLPFCMPTDFIHQHFTPIVLKLTLEAKARPVRSQAARTLLIFLRYNLKENHRKWIRENLIVQLCQGKSCYTRHIFVNMCVSAFDLFSQKYFKEHFYLPFLSLAEDPVSTIRLCVVKHCHVLKQMLVLPLDRTLQVKLESVFSKMESLETDKDVLSMLKCKLKEMRAPQMSKQTVMIEERRRVEEEDRIFVGKAPPLIIRGGTTLGLGRPEVMGGKQMQSQLGRLASSLSSSTESRGSESGGSGSIAYSRGSFGTQNKMSFLGQHFYTDAGVSLPRKLDTIEDNLRSLKLTKKNDKKDESIASIVPTVSLETVNFDSLSDEELKKLKMSTTNITDDVKANLQKIGLKTVAGKSEEVKKRSKRYSCSFAMEQGQSTKNSAVLKRRSLNIANSECSRIPVCFKGAKKMEERNTVKLNKSKSVQSISTNIKNVNVANQSAKVNKKDEGFVKSDKTGLFVSKVSSSGYNVAKKTEVKENVPESEVLEEKSLTSCKGSNLPVLKRRPYSASSDKR